jgi:hypothetical protein
LARLRGLHAAELIVEARLCASEARIGAALALLSEALRIAELVPFSRSPIMRLRAELLAQDGASAPKIEAIYRDTIEWDRIRANKFDELEGTTQFAQWLTSQSRSAEARAMLSEIYNWFTEGFDTLALREAKALLDGSNQ